MFVREQTDPLAKLGDRQRRRILRSKLIVALFKRNNWIEPRRRQWRLVCRQQGDDKPGWQVREHVALAIDDQRIRPARPVNIMLAH